MRSSFIVFLGALCCMFTSCGPKPLPSDKIAFVGQWKASSGFTLTINANGTATLFQSIDHANPDYERLCITVGPKTIEDIPVSFVGDDILEVSKPFLYAKTYKIDRPPYRDGDSVKMVLNGVTLIKQ